MIRFSLLIFIIACDQTCAATCSYAFMNKFDTTYTNTSMNVIITPFRLHERGSRSLEDSPGRILARQLMHSIGRLNDSSVVYTSPVVSIERIGNLTKLLSGKSNLVSFLFDMTDCEQIPSHWKTVMAQITPAQLSHVFVVNRGMSGVNRKSIYQEAFLSFRFSLILDRGDLLISEPLIHAISMHTVPVYNGFFEMSTMFANGVVAWNEVQFRMVQLVARLKQLNEQVKFLWSYQQILQEIIFYQYSHPVEQRLRYLGQTTCLSRNLPLVFVGIYSTRNNRSLRDAIRASWGVGLLRLGIEFKFFISEGADDDVFGESILFQDIVILPVKDGYRNNSKKGVLFLDWVAQNAQRHRFLIKADDDIYWRPKFLIDHIASRIPVGYVWGFIDYISPVPPDQVVNSFRNPKSVYPFNTFPTYPRGAVRVLSMDLVSAISSRYRANTLRMIFGDDPNLGVHLRQLVLDSVSIFIDDFSSYSRFAMVPTCVAGWSVISNTTWVVHHVNSTQIQCMWAADQAVENASLCHCV